MREKIVRKQDDFHHTPYVRSRAKKKSGILVDENQKNLKMPTICNACPSTSQV
jgi:hypothetical protein